MSLVAAVSGLLLASQGAVGSIFAYSTVLDVYFGSDKRGLSLPIGSKPVSWSPNGKFLLVRQGSRLFMVDRASRVSQPVSYDTDGGLSWLPDSSAFVMSTPKSGIYQIPVKGVARQLSPFGNGASLSPDGTRLAFFGKGQKGGLWMATEEGAKPTLKVPNLDLLNISWSPDSRRLAVVNSALELRMAQPSGELSKVLGRLDSPSIQWQPSGKSLLGSQRGSPTLFDATSGAAVALDASLKSLTWVRSQELAGLRSGKIVLVDVKSTPKVQALEPMPDGCTALFPYPGVFGEGVVADPLRASSPPPAEQIRLRGIVDKVDAAAGKVTLRVSQVLDPKGNELNLGRPVVKDIKASRIPAELKPDCEVGMVVRGKDLNSNLELVSVQMESSPSTPGVANPPTSTHPNPATAVPDKRVMEADGVCMDVVTVPMIFPVLGKTSWSDSFLTSRGGGSRRHHGQDLMASKMTPLVACFDGTVNFKRTNVKNSGNMITLTGDNGWTAWYIHVNNDTPGTDDGLGTDRFAFAANLQPGDRVVAGQFLGWVGDSGNAEETGPHCHFELHETATGAVLNALDSLKGATHIEKPVYADPDGALVPGTGEVRLDGVVNSVDEASGTIVLDMVARCERKGDFMVCVRAEQTRIKVTDPIPNRADPAQKFSLKDLRKGSRICCVGKGEDVVTPRLMWAELPPTSNRKKIGLLPKGREKA